MFTNENACTIWEKTIQDHMEVYVPHVFYDVYCQTTTAQTVQNTSREPNDGYLFIIHQSKIPYMPKKDDKIILGAFFEDIPQKEAFTVSEVRNFLFGSWNVRHIEVIAK